jgi:hypothetical protein
MKMTEDTIDNRLNEMGEGNFSEFYKRHAHEGKASLRRAQWKTALDGNPTMQIWLGKQNLGQRDNQDIAMTGQIAMLPYDVSKT